jgi:uncharacterized membrane protein YfcA
VSFWSVSFEPWQWALLFVAAFLVGVSKTGIAGLGILFVSLFANVFSDTKQATGIVLPLLLAGDLIAVLFYRRHTAWRYLRRLFPWAAAGVVAGFFAMGRLNDVQVRVLIGGIILVLSGVHVYRQWAAKREAERVGAKGGEGAVAEEVVMPVWFCPVIGVLMGFTTLVANAAGPLAVIFFLAARLPKMEFVGTGAVFFMILNWFKVPFMVSLGLINAESLRLNALLIPVVFVGALIGRWILHRVNQSLFETIALVLGILAGLKLLWV